MEKNKFFTFVYSFIPGAGYMYLNMMQVGVVAMLLFFGVGGVAATIHMEQLLFVLPIIWFYTFFDTFHVAKMDLEAREERQAKMMESLNGFLGGGFTEFVQGKKKVIGMCIMFFGIYIMVIDFVFPLLRQIPLFEDYGYFHWISNRLPTLVIGLLLLYGGNKLFKQEQNIQEEEEESVEYECEAVKEQGKELIETKEPTEE